MFRPLLHSPTAAGLGSWLGIIGAVGTFLSWIVKMTPEWFGELTWPQSILIGLAGTLAFTLLLSLATLLGGVGYRYFRPITHGDANSATKSAPQAAYDLAGKTERKSRLTIIERERCAEALRDLHDFIVGEVMPLYEKIKPAGTVSRPTQNYAWLFDSLEQFKFERVRIYRQIEILVRQHQLYLELLEMNLSELVEGIGNLGPALGKLATAGDWPHAAVQELALALARANSEMNNAAGKTMNMIRVKREENLK